MCAQKKQQHKTKTLNSKQQTVNGQRTNIFRHWHRRCQIYDLCALLHFYLRSENITYDKYVGVYACLCVCTCVSACVCLLVNAHKVSWLARIASNCSCCSRVAALTANVAAPLSGDSDSDSAASVGVTGSDSDSDVNCAAGLGDATRIKNENQIDDTHRKRRWRAWVSQRGGGEEQAVCVCRCSCSNCGRVRGRGCLVLVSANATQTKRFALPRLASATAAASFCGNAAMLPELNLKQKPKPKTEN